MFWSPLPCYPGHSLPDVLLPGSNGCPVDVVRYQTLGCVPDCRWNPVPMHAALCLVNALSSVREYTVLVSDLINSQKTCNMFIRPRLIWLRLALCIYMYYALCVWTNIISVLFVFCLQRTDPFCKFTCILSLLSIIFNYTYRSIA